VLYGRDADCAAVRDRLDAARVSRSSVEVVRGEPGVGKTALLEYAAEQARDLGVLRGVGVESEVALPFAALHQLLYPVLDRLPALPAPQAAALGGAFGITPGRSDDPFLVAVAVLTLLGEVSADGGLLCLVDDAQWLDQASADVLRFVARRLDAEGLVLLFAARDGERRAFATSGLPERRLRGLEPRSAAALLDETAPGLAARVRARLVDRTAGNPLALLELPRQLTAGQRSGFEALPDRLPLGRSIEGIFADRASGLPQSTQELLLIAAAEESGDLGTVLRAAAGAGIAPDALDEAERAGLVTVRDGQLHFTHPLVRSAVYQRTTFARRQNVHRNLAAILSGPEDVDRCAWHLAAATPEHDDRVAAALEDSADRARRRGGVAAAADALERAAHLSEHSSERGRRLLGAANDAWLANQRDRADKLLTVAEHLVEDRVQRARAEQLAGLMELRRGMPEKAYRILLRGAAAFVDIDTHTALETLVLAGEAAAFIGEPGLATEVGRLALALPDNPSPEDRSMRALLVGLASALRGDPADGIGLLREVVEGALGLDDPAQLLWGGRAALYLGELDVARALYERGVDQAEVSGAVGMLAVLLDRVAWTDAVAGRPAQAAASAERGLELAGELGLDAGVALGSLALVAAIRGDEQACRAAAERAHALAQARHLRIVAAAADWALGLLDLGLGRPAEALARILELTGSGGHPGILLWAVPDLVEAAAWSGRPERCAAVVERFERWARGSGLPVPAAAAERCRGLLSHGDEAVEHFVAALGYDPSAQRPFERARTELALGETLRRMRRRSDARVHLRNAMDVFERLGAAPWADRARAELRATGETVRRRDPSTVEQLTPQELLIARLAGGGVSNPDIAAKLFLSRRTVEYHLRKVFTKLGVTSRLELVNVDPPGP
jgi:DNA-binding CsgD family transcriptional regulator/tetratricopeptide (TPR) repeat protein